MKYLPAMGLLFRSVCLIHVFIITLVVSGCHGIAPEARQLKQQSSRRQNQVTLQLSRKTEMLYNQAFTIKGVTRRGRSPIHLDAIEAQIIAGTWKTPKEGDTVTLPDGTVQTWEFAKADEDGWFKGEALRGGYVCVPFNSSDDCTMILEMSGNSMAYFNGNPCIGDCYKFGYVRLPVSVKKGSNYALFQCSRGSLKAKLVSPKSSVMLNTADATLPDLIVGKNVQNWAAVVVINTTDKPMTDLHIKASLPGAPPTITLLGRIGPMTARKVGFELKGPAPPNEEECEAQLTLMRGQKDEMQTLDTTPLTLRIRRPDQTRKHTFISNIDGSVQYYGLNPASPLPGDTSPPALFITVHGASCKAIGQVGAYSSKTWGHVVAPTNRRPFGFDWEDWGRMDTIEVLEHAQKQLQTDPQRTYLTGHSMGGHGAWHLGALFPDRFAAIGPSAGWISFWTYTGAKKTENLTAIEEILLRADLPSDTLPLAKNYSGKGIYILHGAVDDCVPVEQSRTMNKHLSEFHRDFIYCEEPDQNHWWNKSDEPGTDCVDWPQMFDFFARHYLPTNDSIRQIDFITPNPGISASSHWVCIEAQIEQLQNSSVSIRFDPGKRRFVGTTNNVARLNLQLDHIRSGDPLNIELDGQKIDNIPWPEDKSRIWLSRKEQNWTLIEKPSPDLKGPHRYGPFKEAFNHRMMFVYATQGNPEENAWAYAKARYDAEQFWYRGNGSIDVIPDTEFKADEDIDRGVILYGNAETNKAWKALLSESPVQVTRSSVSIDDRKILGDDLACLFLRPRPGSDIACVGAVSGTGIKGMRLTDRLSYLTAGCNYPDYIVIGSEMLNKGSAGVLAAGIFGVDWKVISGQFAWRDNAR